MSFEKIIRIPVERIGVLIGNSGKIKSKIEEVCSVLLDIDSKTGETTIRATGNFEDIKPFKAMEIVIAIGRGFSPDNAMTLLKSDNSLHVIDLRDFVGKSNTQIERIKGRLIGHKGKARINMENLTGSAISVYGRTVAIIGNHEQLRLGISAITALSSGSMHGTVYGKLEAARRKQKIEKLNLWEDKNVFS